MAVALGVRAARAPWVVVVEPDSRPTSDEWLQHLATHFTDENDVVMGYANYEHEEASAVPEANRLRAWDWARSARSVLAGHAAAADGGHVAFRREWFLQSGGFAGSLDLPFGACALLAARADARRVAVEIAPRKCSAPGDARLGNVAHASQEQAVVLQRTAHTAVYVSLRERWNKVMTAVALVAACSTWWGDCWFSRRHCTRSGRPTAARVGPQRRSMVRRCPCIHRSNWPSTCRLRCC